jgi:hypothetical protein
MALSDQTAREIVKIVRKHVDQPTLDRIVEELKEVRGDKDFRGVVELFAALSESHRARSGQPIFAETVMSGTSRLPGGGPRKASQRGRRSAAPPTAAAPSYRPGDRVRWKDRAGIVRRDVGDGEHVEVAIGERVYRVLIKELN